MHKCFVLLVLTSMISNCTPTPNAEPLPPKIIPQPLSISSEKGYFEITNKTTISVENEEQQKIAASFFKHFSTVTGWQPKIIIGGVGDIIFIKNKDLPNEGYELNIEKEKITINAQSGAGYFYALHTISQLLPVEFSSDIAQKNTRWVLPLVNIKDQPRFGWRGFMLDVSRHFYDKKYIYEILDQMAALKLNTFHWHLTDDQGWRVEIKKYPKLTEVGAWRVDYNDHDWGHNRWWGRPKQQPEEKATYGGFYTQEEIKDIIKYAEERFITIIPEIDMPGHSQAIIASYPEVACHPGPYYVATGGVYKDNTLCPGKEITFEFVENVLNEIMDLFPSEFIHIGGDECNKEAWKKDADCQARIKKEALKNENELQSYFIKRVEEIINARGRNLIGWDEILEGGLAPNATVMSWRGEEGGIAAAKEGHKIIMTPSKYCYLDLKQGHTDHEPNLGYSQCLLSTCYNYNPVPEKLKDQSSYILGMQGNLWSESLPDWEKTTYMAYPRLFAIAENAWSSQAAENWDDFIDRLYPQLARLEQKNILYAKSAFNVWIGHKGNGNNILVDLHTEANSLEIRYTLNGSDPDLQAIKYSEPFVLTENTKIKAAAFKEGNMIGKITEKEFFVHKAKNAKVIYHTPFKKKNRNNEEKMLTDLNYGSNWLIDTLWQEFNAPTIEFDIELGNTEKIKQVKMNFLQMAISGIYMPENIEILSSIDGNNFVKIASQSLEEFAKVQGRYIQRTTLEFPETTTRYLKVKLSTVGPIYKGHHRDGEQSRLFIDEVVVL